MVKVRKKVLTLLGTEVNSAQVETIIELVEGQLLRRLQSLVPETNHIPTDLEYITIEMAVARFNRIGSEGMVSESVEGHSATYARSLSEYDGDILAWADSQGYETRRGKVRAL